MRARVHTLARARAYLPVPCDMAASQVRLLLTHMPMLLLPLPLLSSFVLAAAVDPSTTSGNLMPLSPVSAASFNAQNQYVF